MVALPELEPPTVTAMSEALCRTWRNAPSLGIAASMASHECDRALWYGLKWATPGETPSAERIRLMNMGETAEAEIIAELEAAGVTVTRRQEKVRLASGWLRGKIDGVAEGVPEASATPHLLEIKEIKGVKFNAVRKHGVAKSQPGHWTQCQIYMRALGLTRALYVCRNRDTGEVWAERIQYDEHAAAGIEARAERIAAMETAPLRLHDDPDSKAAFVCRFCDHRDVCHAGAWSQVNCRTCLHGTLGDDAVFVCARHSRTRTYPEQREGCPQHLYIPSLVPGEQVDADEKAATVEYRLADGSTWTDGRDPVPEPTT